LKKKNDIEKEKLNKEQQNKEVEKNNTIKLGKEIVNDNIPNRCSACKT